MKRFGPALGERAVRIAREVLEDHIRTGNHALPDDAPAEFREKAGAFVTLKTWPGHELRGCIGYPEPVCSLLEAIVENAINASTRDPRFRPLGPGELGRVVVEVSLLTPPERVDVRDPNDLPAVVRVGRDGLIVENGPFKGLLLPQVPVEHGWGPRTFLEHTCRKAGLPVSAWKQRDTVFHAFRAEVYAETEPRGDISEHPPG